MKKTLTFIAAIVAVALYLIIYIKDDSSRHEHSQHNYEYFKSPTLLNSAWNNLIDSSKNNKKEINLLKQ